jgi:hypothetical protein
MAMRRTWPTEPFKENMVVPMLETRVRDFYEVVEPA